MPWDRRLKVAFPIVDGYRILGARVKEYLPNSRFLPNLRTTCKNHYTMCCCSGSAIKVDGQSQCSGMQDARF